MKLKSKFDQYNSQQYSIDMNKICLLVEDNELIRKMYQLKLAKSNIEVIEAVDGTMALTMIAEHQPKIVLLDLMMPNVGGIEVLEELKKQKITPDLPVIVLTNIMDQPTIDQAMLLGARDYIVKTDLTPSQVMAKIKPYLQ